MSRPYASFSDEFYLNMHLNTEMDLPTQRETVLHFFEQIQKQYPVMRNFYTRDRGEIVLEEDKDKGSYRWATLETRRICSGNVNPDNLDDVIKQHSMIVDLLPYTLSVSPIDCESLNLMYGFDFNYRGNHNAIVAEALGILPAFDKLQKYPGAQLLCNEPSIQFAIDEDCRTQVRLSIETRTTAYQIRTDEFPEDQISVYLTARRFGSLGADESYGDTLKTLYSICTKIIDNYVVENVLEPLKQAIVIN